MNIFFLDNNPQKCAEYHNNKHVVKMILETAQLLCGVHHIVGSQLEIPYKLSHKNHPCSIWTRECVENYVWLCDLGIELCKEYTYRYGKKHKSQQIIEWCMINIPKIPSKGRITPPALAMPDERKILGYNSAVNSYREYYIKDKSHIATWTKRQKPSWYIGV
jgi:hypothetical protein